MAINFPYIFQPSTTAASAEVNANFSTVSTYALNKTGDTMTGDLKFTDAQFDIGKSGATRPRDLFLSRNATIGGTLGITGNTVVGGTLTVTGATTLTGAVTGAGITSILNAVWPIGSVFTAVVSTNPATLIGIGTWTAFGAGRVLVGIDGAQTEFDVVEETGGAKTHTLITAELPVHSHSLTMNPHTHALNVPSAGGGTNQLATTGGNGDAALAISGTAPIQTTTDTGTIGTTGNGTAHNNLQPYIVVYFWKRTA